MIDQQPDVIPQVISQGMTGLQAVGGILSGILLIFIAAKPLLSKLRVGSAMDNAQIDAIERLSKLLNEERELRRQAEERADRFAEERNQAIQKIGNLEGKITALEAEVAGLSRSLEKVYASSSSG